MRRVKNKVWSFKGVALNNVQWETGAPPAGLVPLGLKEAIARRREICVPDMRNNSGCVNVQIHKVGCCGGNCKKKEGHKYVMKKSEYDMFSALTTYLDNEEKELVKPRATSQSSGQQVRR